MVQIAWRDHGIYNVKKLWKHTNNEKIHTVDMSKLKHNLNKDLWTVFVKGKKKYITPMQVIKNPKISPVDSEKIKEADTKYPILVYDDKGDMDILDGLHRLAKLYLLGKKRAKIRYITDDILDKARITNNRM